ncbi:hypothetical protein KC331_g9748 [Hortaea werneckii]|nr:hypothetical protein KC349_g2403 [Hortaea werneckii]KAI7539447.1 hypothetical protein KC331_g9748 [Hortaea werneckii]KAI7711797.1 hypothetical protein KC353_g8736 [Hortaea werneckii]
MAGEEMLDEPNVMDRPALSTDVYPDEEEQEEEPDVFPPPGLKEISSLASWTVSTAKPGNGVAALRSPDLAHFWQSDGPQPHLLSIHFFKLVSIVHIRLFLDFENDESYTPTKIQFLAGMSVHDIQEFAELSVSEPQGWYEVSFDNVGRVDPEDESDEEDPRKDVDWSKRPVLRAFLIQVRILENHQNGKDTHLRAVQLFARDDSEVHRRPANEAKTALPVRTAPQLAAKRKQQNNIKMASWMMEPDLR